jgi:hypothetical protein
MYVTVRDSIAPTRYFGGLGADDPAALAALGNLLWQEAPAGVTVALYDSKDAELKRRGMEWGKRQGAFGPRGSRLEASEIEFRRGLPDARNLKKQILQLGTILKNAVAAVPAPSSVQPLPDTGPSQIRTLAIFTHGSESWILTGGSITSARVGGIIKAIAPALTNDVKIILYGCSSAKGVGETSNWMATTSSQGGADSLAARMRDALVDAGKSKASVWGHTEVGHTTRNPSLRVFHASDGKGIKGHSYLSESIFGTLADAMLREEIAAEMATLGFTFAEARQAEFRTKAAKQIRKLRYSCYARAVVTTQKVGSTTKRTTNLTYGAANLPEMAPRYPLAVADIVRKHWDTVCWTAKSKRDAAKAVATDMRLKRQTAASR